MGPPRRGTTNREARVTRPASTGRHDNPTCHASSTPVRHHLPTISRYLVVGAVAFVVDYSLTRALVTHWPLLVANTVGFAIANVANFALAHRWVFGHAWDARSVVPAYLSVLAISVAGLILNDAVVWALVGMAELPLLAGKAVATGIVLIWNFAARVLWTYRKRPS
jgi:putative flippase GtrA